MLKSKDRPLGNTAPTNSLSTDKDPETQSQEKKSTSSNNLGDEHFTKRSQ